MKTHFKKLKNPDYIGSWDLMDENGTIKNRVVKIILIEKRQVFDGNGKSEELPVAVLDQFKPLILNASNLKMIAKVLQSNFIEDWAGKSIELTVKKIKAFGDIHDAIRVVQSAPKTEVIKSADQWRKDVENCKTKAELTALWGSVGFPKNELKNEVTKRGNELQ